MKIATKMNEQNLKPFKKGQSGNPKGKPKGTLSLKTLLIDYLRSTDKGQKEANKDRLIKRIGKLSIVNGNEQMIKLIWNYIEGMPKETAEVNINLPIPISDVIKDAGQNAGNTENTQEENVSEDHGV